MNRSFAAAIICAASLAAACTSSSGVQLAGAGSSFDNPFFQQAFYRYSQSHQVQVNYQSIGSGGGIQQFTAKTVDFGASDVPLTPSEMKAAQAAGGGVVEIPVTLGGVTLVYNLPGVSDQLKLDPQALVDIFTGKVSSWRDPEIARLNPAAKLPNLSIVVVHRADGSGTTYIFTDYLSKISPEWKARVGTAKVVGWPAPSSVGAKGNEGVAGQIRNTPGAIGYVELAYVLQNKMTFAVLRNASGAFVMPSETTVRDAAAHKTDVSPSNFSIVDMPGTDSYPICGYSWVMLWQNQPDPRKGKALVDLFRWLVTDGQSNAASVGYVSLPEEISASAAGALQSIRT